MQLKDFLKDTLVQISQGIEEAHQDLKESGTLISPTYQRNGAYEQMVHTPDRSNYPTIQFIDFDVAVSASEEKGNTGGVGVSIASIQIGTKRTQEDVTSTVSRVKFQVPVFFKQHKSGEGESS